MIQFHPSDLAPKSLKSKEVRDRRRAGLMAAQMQALVCYVEALRYQKPHTYVPDFDPATGGADARLLFLAEKPGPMTDPTNDGSGFISICNNDETAAASNRFLEQRGIPVELCMFANVIPWWNGTRRISKQEREDSVTAVAALLALMPRLRFIVLLGATARRCWSKGGFQLSPTVQLRTCMHPSPINRASRPSEWKRIPDNWPTRAELN